jgi:hypothetical protein
MKRELILTLFVILAVIVVLLMISIFRINPERD